MPHDLSRRHLVHARCSPAWGSVPAAPRRACPPAPAPRSRPPAGCAPRSTSATRSSRARDPAAASRSACRSTWRAPSPSGSASPLDLLVFDSARPIGRRGDRGQADIGFFAIDPQRADGIALHRALRADRRRLPGAPGLAAARPTSEVDRAGTRIVVGRGSAYDLYLTRELKQAAARARADLAGRGRHLPGAERRRRRRREAAAGGRRRALGGLRLLPGRFMVIQQAMGVPAARGAAASDALKAYVEWAKRSGFVADALARHRIHGAIVAPAAA